jgi:hypothetical protein
MSSTPSGSSSQNKSGPAGRKGKPTAEKKAVAGPVITPQVLIVVFVLISIVGIAVYWNQNKSLSDKQATVQDAIAEQRSLIATYKKKGDKLQAAIDLNEALREKLSMLDYLFLQDQTSILPFYENTLLPLFESSTLRIGKIEPLEPYNFKINMAMEPFNTIPSVGGMENPEKQFTISYTPEQGGNPVEEPITTKPTAFITPYSLKLKEFYGTYEDCMKFVKKLQTDRNAKMITIHCIKNDESKSAGLYRISTTWDFIVTVYFMNPEVNASGDEPPGLPGSQKC